MICDGCKGWVQRQGHVKKFFIPKPHAKLWGKCQAKLAYFGPWWRCSDFFRYLQGSTAMLLWAKPVAASILKRETDSGDAELWVGLFGSAIIIGIPWYLWNLHKSQTFNLQTLQLPQSKLANKKIYLVHRSSPLPKHYSLQASRPPASRQTPHFQHSVER